MFDLKDEAVLRRLIISNIVTILSAIFVMIWNFSALVTVVDNNTERLRREVEISREYRQTTNGRVSTLESEHVIIYNRVDDLESLHLRPLPDTDGVEADARNNLRSPSSLAGLRSLPRDSSGWPLRRSVGGG